MIACVCPLWTIMKLASCPGRLTQECQLRGRLYLLSGLQWQPKHQIIKGRPERELFNQGYRPSHGCIEEMMLKPPVAQRQSCWLRLAEYGVFITC
jgi:hypothetical protein